MRAEDYEALPDVMESKDVEALVDTFLREEQADGKEEIKRKLDVLCDRQWHTYEVPSDHVRRRLREWLLSRWEASPEFYELAMGLGYSFALDKELFQKALESYHGDQRWEYVEMLEQSPGESMDPYWSLKDSRISRPSP